MAFAKWSDVNPAVKRTLRPDLGLRRWGTVDHREKAVILQHITNSGWLAADDDTYGAMQRFAEDHKAGGFCPNLLEHGGPHFYDNHSFGGTKPCCPEAAHKDIMRILLDGPPDVAYEALSYYAEGLTSNQVDGEQFTRFAGCFNDLAEQYGLDVLLSPAGIVPRQETKITEVLYEPTLRVLADPKWAPVERDLGDAFSDFQKATPEGYSACITHTVAALQGFLQLVVTGEVGKGEIKTLLARAVTEGKISNDPFTRGALKDIVGVLMQERQRKGDPHPKAEYANEKSALLVLNLTMVFLQHCLRP